MEKFQNATPIWSVGKFRSTAANIPKHIKRASFSTISTWKDPRNRFLEFVLVWDDRVIEKSRHAYFLWRANPQIFELSINFVSRYNYWAWFRHKIIQGIDSRCIFWPKMFAWPNNPATSLLLGHAKSQNFEFSILVSKNS